jgi:type IV pilus assembly protein PilY1
MTDNVPTSAFDTKSSQHMVNFTVAFGIEGLLVDTDNDGWPNPVLADNSPNWWGINVPVDDNDKPAKVDDMWHAAWNSRGAFYSAKNPVELVDGLTDALSAIEKRAGAAATVSHTTPFITFGTVGFKGGFDSSDWSGWLIASIVTSAGQEGARVWDTLAGSEFSKQVWNQRKIFTYNPVKAGNNKGIPFVWDPLVLAPAQQTALQRKPGTLVDQGEAMGQARLEFLKGRGVDEAANRDNAWLTANQFRERSTKLGDIVYSEPFYLPGDPGYVFVGANDGMLHAFDAKTGKEVFAYIPSRLFGKLNKLTESPYAHEPYVDGSMAIRKVGNRTILVGTLRSGAQSVYALDVTDPATFDENDVLWEFSDTQDSDLGYVFGKPTITQMYDGNWGVLIGNGYNNSEPDGQPGTGRAFLYVLKVDDGTVLKKFDTQAGNAVTPNGLAAPAGLDGDLDGKVDFIYAGDLQGKLWKFDVTSNNPAQWNIAFGTAAAPEPLFKATSPGGVPQPITTRPQADAFPPDAFANSPGYGYLIYFGTGQYIEPNDKITNQGGMQTVYGVWDRYSIKTVRNTVGDKDPNDLHPFDRSHLLQQKIIAVSPDPQFPNDPTKGRYVIDNEPIDWHNDLDANNLPKSNPAGNPPTHLGWFVDLDPVIGERVVVDSDLRNRKLIVNTTISDATDPCAPGGRSNTLVLDAISGSRLGYSAFDLNKDKKFDQNDLVTITVKGVQMIVPVSSVPSEQGILTRPVIVEDLRTGVSFPCMVGSTGNIECQALAPDLETFGRENWRSLITP